MSDFQEALPGLCALPLPVEDAGALAQANFRYQSEAIARRCYDLLEADGPLAVLCEYHEDFVVLHRNGDIELVCVKHRDRNRGTWSFGDLCEHGGLVHLFDRWQMLRNKQRDRHSIRALHLTNAGLTSGSGRPAELAELCRAEHYDPALHRAWAKRLARQSLIVAARHRMETIPRRDPPKQPETLADDDTLVCGAAEFLRHLRFSVTAHRDDIAATTIHHSLIPWFQRQGWNHCDVAQSHDRVVAMVEKTVRSLPGQWVDLARYSLDPGRWSANEAKDQHVAARTIDAERVMAVLVPGEDPPLFLTDRPPLPAPGGKRLREKMSAGRLSSTQHQLAERLRSAWYTTRCGQLPDLPGDAAMVAQIEAEVLELVIDLQEAADQQCPEPDHDRSFGRVLFKALRNGIEVKRFHQRPPLSINDRHALGVALDLSDQCHFSFERPTPVVADVTDEPGPEPSDGSGLPGTRDA
jgi:hypothetical protein